MVIKCSGIVNIWYLLGLLPESIGCLTALQYLQLDGNKLSGMIYEACYFR